MPLRTISLQLPAEIAQELETRTQVNGGSETEIILNALAQTWGLPTPAPTSTRMATFQRQLQAIKARLDALSDHQTALQEMHNVALQLLDNSENHLENSSVQE